MNLLKFSITIFFINFLDILVQMSLIGCHKIVRNALKISSISDFREKVLFTYEHHRTQMYDRAISF